MEKISKYADNEDVYDSSFGEIINKYRPKLIGSGGHSVVYILDRSFKNESRENISSVIKIDTESVSRCLGWINQHPDTDIAQYYDDPEQQEYLESFKNAKREQAEMLRTYFGPDSVPAERVLFLRVPITQDALENCMPEDFNEDIDVKDVYVIAVLQTIQSGIDDVSQAVDLTYAGYLENNTELEDDVYVQATKKLAISDNGLGVSKEEIFTWFPRLALLNDIIQTDPRMNEMAKSFVETVIEFSNETGKCLDIVGDKNIVIDRNAQKIRFIDPFPKMLLDLHESERIMQTISIKDINSQNGVDIINALNYARYINALAAVVGTSSRINSFTSIDSDIDEKLLRIRTVAQRQSSSIMRFLYSLFGENE